MPLFRQEIQKNINDVPDICSQGIEEANKMKTEQTKLIPHDFGTGSGIIKEIGKYAYKKPLDVYREAVSNALGGVNLERIVSFYQLYRQNPLIHSIFHLANKKQKQFFRLVFLRQSSVCYRRV